MINIKSADFLPGLYKPFKEGQLTEEKPYQFINGGYEENLTKSGWDALKKFAVKPAKNADADEDNGTADQGGELPPDTQEIEQLKAEYEAYPSKNDKKGRAMRAKIKELEQAKGK